MRTLKPFFFILFFYVVFEPIKIFAYDQVQVEKIIPLVSKKSLPGVLRIDNDKNLWILDQSNLTIQKISKEGKIEFVLKPGKKKDDLFREPVDFAFANDGSIVVADAELNRVVLINKGEVQLEIPFKKPTCVAVSRDDIVAVGSLEQKAILFFSKDGVPLHVLFPPDNEAFKSITALAFGRDGVLWVLDGEQGKLHRFSNERKWLSVANDLGNCLGLAVDDFGFAYVTTHDGRWKEIDKDGKITGSFGAKGKSPGQLLKPFGAALFDNNRLWVSEEGNDRLQLFAITNAHKEIALTPQPAAWIQVRKAGVRLGAYAMGFFGHNGDCFLFNQKKEVLEHFDSKGTPQPVLTFKSKIKTDVRGPRWFGQDKEGNIWVLDEGDHAIKRISPEGNVMESLGEKGKKEGSLKDPSFFSIRPDHSFVVVDRGNSRIQVLSPKGLFLFSVGGTGKGSGKFKTVSGVAASASLIAVIDNEGKSLLFYDSNGKFSHAVSNPAGGAGYWKELSGVTVDPEGRFYVNDRGSSRIRLFGIKGEYVADFSSESQSVSIGSQKNILAIGEKEVKIYNVYVVPKALVGITAADDSGNVHVQWENNADSPMYRVYRSSVTNQYLPLITSTSTETFDAAVTPGVTYRYAVAGVNELGYEGKWGFSDPIKASRRKDVSLVSITSSTLNPVFAAAFKFYSTKPIGVVTVKNNDSKPYRDLKISMSMKKYTDYATDTVIKNIDSGQEIQVPVNMTFNDSVLELTENTPVQVDVKLIFFEDNTERIVSQNAPLLLYSRNAISWTDTDRLSSFITPRDVPIVDFSRAAIKSFLNPLKTAAIGKPLAKAALLYESVNALGMSYVPDPKTPFAEVSGKPDVLDYVQFPRETLERKLGDCDDTTALMASLLESIGVGAAIVDLPGHVLVMANLEENDKDIIGLPIERFVEYKGTYWVPIETTKFGKTFTDSWQAGIAAIKAAQEKNQAKFFTVLEASQKYPPVTLTEVSKEKVSYPEEKVKMSFLPLLEKLQKERYQTQLAVLKEKIRGNPSNVLLSLQLGMVHVEGGNIAEAKNIFTSYLTNPSSEIQSSANNNLGNLDYLAGDYKAAADHYAAAAKLTSDDGGVLLNQARTAWKLNDEASAKKFLLEAKELLPEWRDFVSDIPAELLPAN